MSKVILPALIRPILDDRALHLTDCRTWKHRELRGRLFFFPKDNHDVNLLLVKHTSLADPELNGV